MLEKNRAWCLEALLYHTQRFFAKYGFALPHAYQTTAYVGTKSFFGVVEIALSYGLKNDVKRMYL